MRNFTHSEKVEYWFEISLKIVVKDWFIVLRKYYITIKFGSDLMMMFYLTLISFHHDNVFIVFDLNIDNLNLQDCLTLNFLANHNWNVNYQRKIFEILSFNWIHLLKTTCLTWHTLTEFKLVYSTTFVIMEYYIKILIYCIVTREKNSILSSCS